MKTVNQYWGDGPGGTDGCGILQSVRSQNPFGLDWDKWESIIRAISGFKGISANWDGDGAVPPSVEKIESAIRFCQIMRETGCSVPHGVCPLSDGNILVEWQFPDRVFVRFEVEDVGRGEFMVTRPDKNGGRLADFVPFRWASHPPAFATCWPKRPTDLKMQTGDILEYRQAA